MVTHTTPSRAKAAPSYAPTDPEPFMNEPPWIQTSTGSPPAPSAGVHNVEVQAVLARDHFLGEQRLVLRRVVALGHGRPERGRIALARPGRDGLGREHPVRAERRCRVGDAEEGGHP